MFLSLKAGVQEKLNFSIKTLGSKYHFTEINKYLIKTLTELIVEYLNDEIFIIKYGLIVSRSKIFDLDTIDFLSRIISKSDQMLLYEKVHLEAMNILNIDWLDNHQQIEYKREMVEIRQKIPIIYYRTYHPIFPLMEGVYKIIPISNVVMRCKNIPEFEIKEETYFTYRNKVISITGIYEIKECSVSLETLNAIQTIKVFNKNPNLNNY